MNDSLIDISNLDKAAVLQALFNASKQQGLGLLNPLGKTPMTLEQARQILEDFNAQTHPDCHSGKCTARFDYLMGRVLKWPPHHDLYDPWLFDMDNGEGASARALAPLLNS